MRFAIVFAVLAALAAAAVITRPSPSPSPPSPPRRLTALQRFVPKQEPRPKKPSPAAVRAARRLAERGAREARRAEQRHVARLRARDRRRALVIVRDSTPISAYGGYVAFSRRTPDGTRYALWVAHGHDVHRLDVPPRDAPFDVDLGPDAAGRPAAVYSRCTKEPSPRPRPDWSAARGCHLRMVELPGGAEQSLAQLGARGGSQTTPAIFGGDIAFAEQMPGEVNPRIMLWRRRTRTTRRLPGGVRAVHCHHVSPTCGSAVLQMDMSARIVAYNWVLRGPDDDIDNGIGPEWELRGDHIGSGRRYLQDQGYYSGACGASEPDSPSIDANGFAWLQWSQDCDENSTERIVDNAFPHAGWLSAEPPDVDYPPRSIYAMARDGRTTYWLAGPHTEDPLETDACAKGCLLMRSRHLDFQPVPRSDHEGEDG